jgi:hypothetical protein
MPATTPVPTKKQRRRIHARVRERREEQARLRRLLEHEAAMGLNPGVDCMQKATDMHYWNVDRDGNIVDSYLPCGDMYKAWGLHPLEPERKYQYVAWETHPPAYLQHMQNITSALSTFLVEVVAENGADAGDEAFMRRFFRDMLDEELKRSKTHYDHNWIIVALRSMVLGMDVEMGCMGWLDDSEPKPKMHWEFGDGAVECPSKYWDRSNWEPECLQDYCSIHSHPQT